MTGPRRTPSCTRPPRRGGPARAAGAVLAAGASIALLAGCASASDSTTTVAEAAPAAVTSAAAASLPALAGRVVAAVSAATSVHVTSDLTGLTGLSAAPLSLGSVQGDVALAGGRPTAAAVTAGGYALRDVDGSAWVTLPGAPAATPWTAVSPTSSNPLVAMAATRLGDLEAKIRGIDPTTLLGAASDLRDEGADTVNGLPATRYSFTVDHAVLAKALGVDASKAAAAGSVPVQLWLDGSDRPAQVTATPTHGGTATPVTVAFTAWNAPVSITAPDPAQVAR